MEDKDIAGLITIVIVAVAVIASFFGVNMETFLTSVATILTTVGAYLKKVKSTFESKFKVVQEFLDDFITLESKQVELLGYVKTALKNPETIDQASAFIEETIEVKIQKLRELREGIMKLIE